MMYRIAVYIPARVGDDLIDSLFDTVADAVIDWEPEDRDGWDVAITGALVEP